MELTKNEAIRKVLDLNPDEYGAEEKEGLLAVYAFMADFALFPHMLRDTPLNKAELIGLTTLRTIIAALQDE